MIKDSIFAALEAANERRAERRRFLKFAGGSAAAVGSMTLLSGCFGDDDDDDTPAPTPTPSPTASGVSTDIGILQLALNLEYLEAQYYAIAVLGRRLDTNDTTGTVGTAGSVTGGSQVTFDNAVTAAYAREIAYDEIAHVKALRAVITSVSASLVINQPAIDISAAPFTAAAVAAGILTQAQVSAGTTFNPYASTDNFLLGAFLFEDVGVTAYKGASPLVSNKTYLEAAAGILAAEAYHAGTVRTELYRRGLTDPQRTVIQRANRISNARDSLDGTTDIDQGLTIGTSATVAPTDGTGTANLVPADQSGIAYSRNSQQVHNIVYLSNSSASSGGFFPAGTNNSIASLRVGGTFS